MDSRECENCGQSFQPKSWIQKWCKSCTTRTCKRCGKTFRVPPIHVKRGKAKFCSVECTYKPRSLIDNCDGTHTIPLTQGKVALINNEDVGLVSGYNWYAVKMANTWYAKTHQNEKTLYLHRLITNPPEGLQVDHINGDGLDNRRSNLRLCVMPQNQRNQHARQGGYSRYKGVTWHKRLKKWQAQINFQGRHEYLGVFESEKQAAKAYDEAAKQYHGEFANLNFPAKAEQG